MAAAPESGAGIFGDFFNLLLTPQEDLEALTNGASPNDLSAKDDKSIPIGTNAIVPSYVF